jgi:glyoxylase-like metal-dependent hydrolase (beta-lactamase superfamily II)
MSGTTTRDNQAEKIMSLKFTVDDLTIHRIIEQETTFLPALEMLPGLTPELLAENRAWMRDAGALDDKDVLILCFQSYVVKTPHHTILIDSCIGNDKPRPLRPKWNMKTDDTYARALAAAGISVGDIDYVMCTHLHVDHVGWNTRLDNGRWVPTACCRWSRRNRPRSSAAATRSATTPASCRRRGIRPATSLSPSAAARMAPYSPVT